MSDAPKDFRPSRDGIKMVVMKKIFANPALAELLDGPKNEDFFFLQLFSKLAAEEYASLVEKFKAKDAELLILRGSLLKLEKEASDMRAEVFDANQEVRRLHKEYRIGEKAQICKVCKSPNRDISKGPVCYACDTSPLKFMRSPETSKTSYAAAAAGSSHTSLQVEAGSKRSLSVSDSEDDDFGAPRFQSTELPRGDPRRPLFKTPLAPAARSETQELFTDGSGYDSMSDSQARFPESESQDTYDDSYTEDRTLDEEKTVNDIENDETEIP